MGTGTFPSKLRAQLADASPDAVQVGAELLYVHALIANTASWSAKAKLTLINTVTGFRDSGTSPVPAELEAALAGGAVNTGQAYGSYRWKMFHYLIRVFGAIKSLPPDARITALESLEAYRNATADVDPQTAWAQQFALEHLLFPDVAPPVIGREDRDTLIDAFGTHGDNVVDIYANLEPNERYGPHTGTNPYVAPYLHQWKPEPLEDVYAGWALDVMTITDLEQEERSYKLARVDAIADALRAARDGENPGPLLRAALRGFNVVDYRVVDTFLKFASDHRQDTIAALTELRRDPGPESVDRFLDHIPVEALPGIGARLSLASALLLGCDAERLPPWRETAALATHRLSGGRTTDSGASAGEVYLYFLERFDAIKQSIDRRIVATGSAVTPLRDRLDTQGLAWTIANEELRPTEWAQTKIEEYNRWRLGTKKATSKPVESAQSNELAKADHAGEQGADVSFEDLATSLYLDSEGSGWLRETIDALQEKRQLILQGPPGTGKTFQALAIANFLAGSKARVTTVQFHPGTSYEDFVQGLRPDVSGNAAFSVVDGPLLKLARTAAAEPDETFVLVIDEINRGNVAAVFGELYFLLEYRDDAVTLTYGEEHTLPENLLIIGTMNTADRSITSLDAALRRRFYVRDLRPQQPPVDGSLRRFLDDRAPALNWLADLLDRANSLIGDQDQFVGPSHFMSAKPTEQAARRAWEYSVQPTLRELFYAQPEKWEQFDFDLLKTAILGTHDVDPAD